MNKKYLLATFVLIGFSGICFAKEDVAVDLSGKVASFGKAHKAIQTSCMPCHSAQLPLPWYGRLPLIKQKMKKDYLKAIEGFNLDSQIYVVGQPPSADALSKIEQVLQKETMPPRLYFMKHLTARLSKQEEWAILNWIRDERAEAQHFAPTQIPRQLASQSVAVVAPAVPSANTEEKVISSAPAKKTNPFKPFNS